MAVIPTMEIEYEWQPAWKDALREDVALQRVAAERLATYFNEGKIHVGRTGQNATKIEATAVPIGSETRPTTWGVMLRFQLELRLA